MRLNNLLHSILNSLSGYGDYFEEFSCKVQCDYFPFTSSEAVAKVRSQYKLHHSFLVSHTMHFIII